MWGLNEQNRFNGLSKNVYYANGFGGNFIVIDNEHDLVIVTRWLEPSRLGDFVQLVIGSVDDR